jgi:hypothetical protein
VLAYERRLGSERLMIALNMIGKATTLRVANAAGEVLLSTYLDDASSLNGEEIRLRADEGLVLRAPADDVS